MKLFKKSKFLLDGMSRLFPCEYESVKFVIPTWEKYHKWASNHIERCEEFETQVYPINLDATLDDEIETRITSVFSIENLKSEDLMDTM